MDHLLDFSDQTSRIARWGRLLFLACNRCSYLRLRGLNTITLIILVGLASPAAVAAEIHADTEVATAGYYQLTWEAENEAEAFQIEEAANPDFTGSEMIYQGPDRATVITGRANGEYYYRARILDSQGVPGDWSAAIKVEVDHHPLSRALGFFIIGAIVFIAILIAIVTGNRRHRDKE